jgi:acyl-CoA thioesterase-1
VIRRAILGLATLVAACRPAADGRPLVAFLGDSLTSGWMVPEAQAYPTLVGRSLRERSQPVRVLNAGVRGDTVAQGLARLDGVLARRPDVLVVALGINDAIRGHSLDEAERGLTTIVRRGQDAGARVVLVGMRIPEATLGPEHAARFASLYLRVAADRRVHFVPFLLEGVAGVRELNFPDGLHPNGAGHARLAQNVLQEIEMALAEVRRR